jgi:hypothetical protein
MADLKDVNVSNIQPIVSSGIFKIFDEELSQILKNISSEYNLDYETLKTKYSPDISNIGVKLGVKKRNRRVLPKDVQCMGRKIDMEQCTRSRRPGSDYCLSHSKRLPHGRIDDANFVKKQKGKRGRKRKSSSFNEQDYITTKIEVIKGIEYLVDEHDNVFSYNMNNPEYLGKKQDIQNSKLLSDFSNVFIPVTEEV